MKEELIKKYQNRHDSLMLQYQNRTNTEEHLQYLRSQMRVILEFIEDLKKL